MNLKDNEMNRSVTQALYKYLPEAWIDFYVKKTRSMYTAKVRSWNSEILTNINSHRLIEKVISNIYSFQNVGGKLDGFGPIENISIDTFDVRTPRLGNNPDIFAEVSPLTFYCSQCNKIQTLKESSDIKKYTMPKSNCCFKHLKQISLLYSCECGWAGPVTALPCKEHGFEHIKYNGKFGYICSICNKQIQMLKKCPVCKKIIRPKPALDSSHFIPATLSTIDLINMKEEQLLSQEGMDGAKIIIGNWLGKISPSEYNNFLNNGIPREDDPIKVEEYKRMFEMFKSTGISDEQAKTFAHMAVYKDIGNIFKDIDDYFDINIKIVDIDRCASNILEYYRVLNGEDNKNYISTIEDAKRISLELNTSNDSNKLDKITKAFGISNIQACGNVPFIFCSYGYTRKSNDPMVKKDLTLKAFPSESKTKKNFYAVKLNTEGILIEFDKKMILEWMAKNKFISENDLPIDLNDETQLKEWFINKIKVSDIPTFANINRTLYPETSYVYNLLHSMSHALLKQAGELCGLDKNSLSEYIFPQVPAVFIYCQNSQGLSLGALFNLFEAYLDRWLKMTLNSLEKCIFDPICIDRDRACTGCLYINEVSCSHFNKDLDRRYLIGHHDKATKEKTYGFWEGIRWP